jgi:hypothetical protein
VIRGRRRAVANPAAGPALGTLCGVVLAIAVFLPWYSADIGTVFTAGGSTGWESTAIAKWALALGVVAAAASALLALDAGGAMPLDAPIARALGWLVLAVFALAAVLVGYRLIALPGPVPEFLSREIGVFLAMAAALGGVLCGVQQVAARY